MTDGIIMKEQRREMGGGKREGKQRESEVERKSLTSYPATTRSLQHKFCIIALQLNHRGMTIQTQTHPNHYTHFSHTPGRTGALRCKCFLDLKNEIGEERGRTVFDYNG